MGISAYKEITEWNEPEFVVPNHTYLFDGKSNILAYARESDGEIKVFNKPIPMDTRRRKFEKVNHKGLQSIAKTLQSYVTYILHRNYVGVDKGELSILYSYKVIVYIITI